MKNVYLLILTVVMSITLFVGCQKDEKFVSKTSPEQELFFNNDEYFIRNFPNIDIHQLESRNAQFEMNIKDIQSKIRKVDDSLGMITLLIKNYGMPLWGRTLVADSTSDEIAFSYIIPLVKVQNELINGYLKVFKTKSGVFHFKIVRESDFVTAYLANLYSIELLEEIAILNSFNFNIMGSTRELYLYSLDYFRENYPDRIMPRSGCWDDVVVYLGQGTLEYRDAPGKTGDEIAFNRKYPTRSSWIGNSDHVFERVKIWNPDCGGDENYEWVDQIIRSTGGGGGITEKTQWEYLNEINRAKVDACLAWAADETGGVDVVSTSTGSDAQFASSCNSVLKLSECVGTEFWGKSNMTNFLTAMDLGLASQADIDKIMSPACNPEANNILEDYFHCVSGTKSGGMKLKDYLAISETISKLKKQNSLEATALANQLSSSLCSTESNEQLAKVADCINTSMASPEDKSELLDFYINTTLIDPCTGKDIDKDAIFADMCAGKKGLSMAGLNEKLEGVDYIRINKCKDKSISELCPKLAKIMDLFIGEKASVPTCDLLKGLGSSIKTGVFYNLDCENNKITPREDGSKPLGQTYNSQNTNIGIYFNEDLCNKSCLEIASVFIHESLHAEFLRKAFENLPANMKDAFPTAIEFKAAWASMIENEFNNISNQHDIMAAFYVDEYAKAMWKAFGEQGQWESYRYWAYKGLNVAQAVAAGSTIITQEKYTEYTNEWNAIKNQLTINCE